MNTLYSSITNYFLGKTWNWERAEFTRRQWVDLRFNVRTRAIAFSTNQ
jgi:hypothetical protein